MDQGVESFQAGDASIASDSSGSVAEGDVATNLQQKELGSTDGKIQEAFLSKGIAHVRKKLKSTIHDVAVKEALLVSKYKLYIVTHLM